MTQPVLNMTAPLVNERGQIIPPWNSFFQQFTQAPTGVMSLIVTASPFSYQAREPGYINVSGGTVSVLTLVRGLVVINVLNVKLIPVSIKDTVIVTYSVIPTIKFIPQF